MALAIGQHRAEPHRLEHLAGFAAGFVTGFGLTALLTLYVWPAILPFRDELIPPRAGLAAAFVMGIVCGVAADVMVTARQASRR